MAIAYVSTLADFKQALKTGADEIIITEDITYDDVLNGAMTISGTNNATLTLDGCDLLGPIVFENVNIVVSDTINIESTSTLFMNCKINCSTSDPIASVYGSSILVNGKTMTGLEFLNCEITTSAEELFSITPFTEESEYRTTPYSIKVSGGTFADDSITTFVDIPEGCDGFRFTWETPCVLSDVKTIDDGWIKCKSASCQITLNNITFSGGNIVLISARIPKNRTQYEYGHIHISHCPLSSSSTDKMIICSGNSISNHGLVNNYSVRLDGQPVDKSMVVAYLKLGADEIQPVLDLLPITNAIVIISPTVTEVGGLSLKSTKFVEFDLASNLQIRHYLYLENAAIRVVSGKTLSIAKNAFLKIDAFSSIVGQGTLSINGTAKTLPLLGNYSSYEDIGPYLGASGSSNSPDGFNNAVVQKMIDKYGDRIFQIMFDNHSQVLIGYTASTTAKVSEIVLEKVENVDMIGFRSYQRHPQDPNKWISYMTWHATGLIQYISVMDETCANNRPDILTLT